MKDIISKFIKEYLLSTVLIAAFLTAGYQYYQYQQENVRVQYI